MQTEILSPIPFPVELKHIVKRFKEAKRGSDFQAQKKRHEVSVSRFIFSKNAIKIAAIFFALSCIAVSFFWPFFANPEELLTLNQNTSSTIQALFIVGPIITACVFITSMFYICISLSILLQGKPALFECREIEQTDEELSIINDKVYHLTANAFDCMKIINACLKLWNPYAALHNLTLIEPHEEHDHLCAKLRSAHTAVIAEIERALLIQDLQHIPEDLDEEEAEALRTIDFCTLHELVDFIRKVEFDLDEVMDQWKPSITPTEIVDLLTEITSPS